MLKFATTSRKMWNCVMPYYASDNPIPKPAAPCQRQPGVEGWNQHLGITKQILKRCTGLKIIVPCFVADGCAPTENTGTYFRANDLDKKLAQELPRGQKLIPAVQIYSDAKKSWTRYWKHPDFYEATFTQAVMYYDMGLPPKPCPLWCRDPGGSRLWPGKCAMPQPSMH